MYNSDGTRLSIVGEGAGEINLIANPSDSTNWSSTGWTNAATTTTTAGDLPLSGVVPTAIKITSDTSAASEATEYVSYSFTTPASLTGKQKVQFFMRPGTNFISGEWTVSVYQSTTRQSLSTDSSSVTYLPNAAGKFTTYVDLVASTAYTLRFARPVNAGGNAGILNIASVIVGPGIGAQGAVVGPWTSETVSLLGGSSGTFTNSAPTVKWMQDGQNMRLQIYVPFTGTPGTGTGNFEVAVPNSKTLDTANMVSGYKTGDGRLFCAAFDAGNTRVGKLVAEQGSTTQRIRFSYEKDTGSVISGDNLKASFPGAWTTSDSFTVTDVIFPIAEWAGSGVNLAQNDVEYAYNYDTSTTAGDTTSFGYGPGGALIRSITAALSRTVRFPTPFQQGEEAVVQISADQVKWVNVTGFQTTPDGNFQVNSFTTQNAKTYGLGRPYFVNSTDVSVGFGAYSLTSGTSYDTAGTAWSAGAGAYYWRVKKVKGGQAVGFGSATTTSSGLVDTTTQTFAGVKTFNSGLAFTQTNASGTGLTSNAQTLSQYDEFTFTSTVNNMNASAPTVTFKCVRIGKLVTMTMQADLSTGSKNNTSNPRTANVLPVGWRPTTLTYGAGVSMQAETSTFRFGSIAVDTSGDVLWLGANNNNWSSSTAYTLYASTLSFVIP